MDFSELTFLSKLSSFAQIGAIILIFLGGALQASRFYLDKRINHIKEQQAQLEKQKADSTILELGSTISTQVDKIERQSDQVEAQRKKIEEQSREVEAQQQKIREVESKVQPRSISDQKFQELQAELSKHSGEKIEITCILGDTEGMALASRLKSLFQSSGWEVDGVNQSVYTQPIKGIIIMLKDENLKHKAESIFQVLAHAKLHSIGEINPNMKFDIGLVIGARQ